MQAKSVFTALIGFTFLFSSQAMASFVKNGKAILALECGGVSAHELEVMVTKSNVDDKLRVFVTRATDRSDERSEYDYGASGEVDSLVWSDKDALLLDRANFFATNSDGEEMSFALTKVSEIPGTEEFFYTLKPTNAFSIDLIDQEREMLCLRGETIDRIEEVLETDF